LLIWSESPIFSEFLWLLGLAEPFEETGYCWKGLGWSMPFCSVNCAHLDSSLLGRIRYGLGICLQLLIYMLTLIRRFCVFYNLQKIIQFSSVDNIPYCTVKFITHFVIDLSKIKSLSSVKKSHKKTLFF
jgi:hypothetical protein